MSPGPIPKRSTERTRRNAQGEDGLTVKKGEALPYAWPEPNPEWDEVVTDFYNSFKLSGMAYYYQQTDVQWIFIGCEEMHKYRTGRGSAMHLQAILSIFNQDLGVTEGSRRKIKIELDKPEDDAPDVEGEKMIDINQRLKKRA